MQNSREGEILLGRYQVVTCAEGTPVVLNLLPGTMVENHPQKGLLFFFQIKLDFLLLLFVNTSLSPRSPHLHWLGEHPENQYDPCLCDGRSTCTAEGSRWHSWEAGHDGFLCKHFTSTESFCLTALYPISEAQRHCKNTATVWAFLMAVPVAGEHVSCQTASNQKVLTSAERNSVSPVTPALLYYSV